MLKSYFKCTVLIICVYSLFWFIGAHFIKKQVINSLDRLNIENNKISFNEISVSGFPFQWSINIYDLKILESKGISNIKVDDIKLNLNMLLTSLNIDILTPIRLTLGHDFNSLTTYIIKPTNPIKIRRDFEKSLYYAIIKQDLNFLEYCNYAIVTANKVTILKNDKDNSILNNLRLVSESNIIENNNQVNFSLSFDAESTNPVTTIRNLDLNTNFSVNFGNVTGGDFIKGFSIHNFNSNINDNTEFNVTGQIDFGKMFIPQGGFTLSLKNYPDLIEILSIKLKKFVDSKWLKLRLTNVVTKANAGINVNSIIPSETDQNVEFEINFNENGIKIGGIDLNEFNKL